MNALFIWNFDPVSSHLNFQTFLRRVHIPPFCHGGVGHSKKWDKGKDIKISLKWERPKIRRGVGVGVGFIEKGGMGNF